MPVRPNAFIYMFLNLMYMTGNVKLFGAEEDMNLSPQDWNTAMGVFFITYALGGVPSNIALKRFGAKLWLPLLLGLCGLINILQGVQSHMGSFTTLRLLLGIVEAGVYPGCSYVLSSWYSAGELHHRLTLFYSGASLASAFSGLLAYGIGHLDHTWGYRGWRFIYMIEGTFTVCVAILFFFTLADHPSKGASWLTDDEQRFLQLRKQFSQGGGGSPVRDNEAFSWKYVRQSFRSLHVYAIAVSEFTLCTVVYGIQFVLPTIVSSLGYSNVQAQAMSAPPYIFACFVVAFSGWAADRWQQRALSIIWPNAMAAAGFVVIISSVRFEQVPGVTYFGLFLMAGGLYCISPAASAWTALNTAGDMKRAVSLAYMISMSQIGGVMGSNIFFAREAPTYDTGYGICLAMLVLFGVVWPGIYRVMLKRINDKREAMDKAEIMRTHTEEELADMGDLNPLFRYAL